MTDGATLEGWMPEIGPALSLAEVVEKAFDYRGNVTVIRTDGSETQGYLFNRNADGPVPFVQLFDLNGGGPHTIFYREIRTLLHEEVEARTSAAEVAAAWREWATKPDGFFQGRVTRVLVVTAVDLEARGLARHLGLARVAGHDWPHYRGGALDLVCAGPRAAHLEARAAGVESVSLVISAGVCGALSPDLAEGDLVVPEAVMAATRRVATAVLPELRRAGTLVTVEEIVATPEQKARLWVETGALACDMESAAILEWAAKRGLRGAVVRGVSDRASRGVSADLASVVEPDGRVRTTRAMRVVLSRPRAIPEAMMLMSGTTTALKSVAAALGKIARTRA